MDKEQCDNLNKIRKEYSITLNKFINENENWLAMKFHCYVGENTMKEYNLVKKFSIKIFL